MRLGETYYLENGKERSEYIVTIVSVIGYELRRKDYPKTKISQIRLPLTIRLYKKTKN